MEIVNVQGESTVRLRFTHLTEYRYSGPVTFNRHRLVLRPRESHYERVETMQIATQPESHLHWYQDIYGNIIASADFQERSDLLSIQSDFEICKYVPEPPPDDEPWQKGEEFPVFYPGIEEGASHLYRRSVYPPEVEGIRSWVRGLDLLPSAGERGPIFLTLAQRIHEQIGYLRREEPGVRSPLETLELRSGSCRDTAVLMMEAGRSLGFATRFVSGYLESGNSKVGRGSTHAWMEVYLPDRGWVGFDPSIGQPVGLGHVAVAVSYHPRGVMPISGKFDSGGYSPLGMKVAIRSERL